MRLLRLMKAGLSVWKGRISPVFDVSRRLLVVEIADGAEVGRAEHDLAVETPPARARRLAELGVDVLICGAVSRPLEAALAARDVHVIAQTCGDVEDVLRAFAAGRLNGPVFLMPGCVGRRRQLHGWGGPGGRGRGPLGTPRGAV